MKKLILLSLLIVLSNAEGILTEQAKKFGFTHCLNLVSKLEKFILKDNKNYGVWSVTSQKISNNEFFTSTIEVTHSNTSSTLINLTVIPNNKEKTCSFVYTQTLILDKNCIDVANSLKGFKYTGPLNKNISVFEKGNIKIFLMPINNNNCLVQKKEISFRFQKQE